MSPESPIAPPATVAFVGVGKMGTPMAARLLGAGFTVRAFDASAEALGRFIGTHPKAARATTAAEAARGADVAITMLPDGKAVRAAVLDGGIAVALGRGGLVVDMSSSSPVDTQALGRDLGQHGVGLIDAPVSGGVKRAVEGKLAIMAGGPPELVRRARPLFEAMGSSVHETGALGTAHAMKALNNFVSAAGLDAMCEALIIGRRFGLDPATMIDVLNASSGRNNSTESKAKQYILSGTFGSGFALALMAKDLRIAAELAEHLGIGAPAARTEQELWARAHSTLGPHADHTEIFRYLETLHGHGE